MKAENYTSETSEFAKRSGNFFRKNLNGILIRLFLANLFFLNAIAASGQDSTVGMVFAPTDRAVGLRYDRQIKSFGAYGSASWGNYSFPDGMLIKHHVKLSTGIVKYMPNRNKRMTTLFSLGLSAHSYGEMTGELIEVPDHMFDRISFEAGVGFMIDRFNIGWCYDPLRKEVAVNVGIHFN
jgi:hypothetical protein